MRFISCRRGATAIEYGLFAGLAAIVLMSGASTIGEKVNGTFAQAGAAMAATPGTETVAMMDATSSDARLIHVRESQEGFISNHQ